jgi:ribosomal protein S16
VTDISDSFTPGRIKRPFFRVVVADSAPPATAHSLKSSAITTRDRPALVDVKKERVDPGS